MSKQLIMVLLAIISSLLLSSCDIGNVITDIQLSKFPDNIVYYANDSDTIDLAGGTIYTISANGSIDERDITTETTLYKINHNVDFTAPGVYEVHIIYQPPRSRDEVIIRIPVQVIEREQTID